MPDTKQLQHMPVWKERKKGRKRKRKEGRREGKEYVMSETYFEIHQKVVEWMDKEMNRWIAI